MVDERSRGLLALMLTLGFTSTSVLAFCSPAEIKVGSLYSCELRSSNIFSGNAQDVEFSAAAVGYAGLPNWLSILQVNRTSPAYLYGTPAANDVGNLTVEVAAMRRDTFETVTMVTVISVNTAQDNINQRAEIYITNYNTDEFLSSVVLDAFGDIILRVFENNAAHITQVIHPALRGIAVPPAPLKHGVIVQVTAGVANVILATDEQARTVQGQCGDDDVFTNPPANFGLFGAGQFDFDINWCNFVVYSVEVNSSQIGAESDEEAPDLPDVPRHHLQRSAVPFAVILVVCFVIILMLVMVLAWIFFGRREQAFYVSRKKRRGKKEADVKEEVNVKEEVKKHVREISSGPAVAQRHLRDLAQELHRRPSTSSMDKKSPGSKEEVLLEFQDLTDYGSPHRQGNPPPYTYPEGLLRPPLQTELL